MVRKASICWVMASDVDRVVLASKWPISRARFSVSSKATVAISAWVRDIEVNSSERMVSCSMMRASEASRALIAALNWLSRRASVPVVSLTLRICSEIVPVA